MSKPKDIRPPHNQLKRKGYGLWIFSKILILLLSAIITTVILTLTYRWFNPPMTWLMLDRYVTGKQTKHIPAQQIWVSIDSVSPYVIQALVAAEDNLFLFHRGFDHKSIRDARDERRQGKRVRGASTISMQVSKNVFLWHGRTITRKIMEAGFTVLIETFWSKERIMEVYLNIIEFGPSIYGIEAASNHFFKKKANNITRNEAALLTTVMPDPLNRNLAHPSHYMRSYQQRVLRNMRNIGEIDLNKKKNN